jgi:hypothetical protein
MDGRFLFGHGWHAPNRRWRLDRARRGSFLPCTCRALRGRLDRRFGSRLLRFGCRSSSTGAFGGLQSLCLTLDRAQRQPTR